MTHHQHDHDDSPDTVPNNADDADDPTVAEERPDQSPMSSRVGAVDAAVVEVLSGLLVRAVAGGGSSVTPALAAHREALAETIGQHQRRILGGACWCDEWPSDAHQGQTWMEHVADAVLAYFADPAHGLVRDEPSEDERAARDAAREARSLTLPGHRWDRVGRMCECGVECGVRGDRVTVEQHQDEVAATLARSDDGRTAVEPTCPCGCPPDAHIGEIGCPCGLPDESPCSERATAAQVRPDGWCPTCLRKMPAALAARLRHDDGEADRG